MTEYIYITILDILSLSSSLITNVFLVPFISAHKPFLSAPRAVVVDCQTFLIKWLFLNLSFGWDGNDSSCILRWLFGFDFFSSSLRSNASPFYYAARTSLEGLLSFSPSTDKPSILLSPSSWFPLLTWSSL